MDILDSLGIRNAWYALERFGIRKAAEKKRKPREVRAKFNQNKGTVRHANFNGISDETERFAKYVTGIFNETGYIINKLCEYESGTPEHYAELEVHKMRRGPDRILGRYFAGMVRIKFGEENPKISVSNLEMKSYHFDSGLKRFRKRIQDYSAHPKTF